MSANMNNPELESALVKQVNPIEELKTRVDIAYKNIEAQYYQCMEGVENATDSAMKTVRSVNEFMNSVMKGVELPTVNKLGLSILSIALITGLSIGNVMALEETSTGWTHICNGQTANIEFRYVPQGDWQAAQNWQREVEAAFGCTANGESQNNQLNPQSTEAPITSNGIAIVTAQAGLNLRINPDTASEVLMRIPFNSQVQLLGDQIPDWDLITYDGHTGYASHQYLNVVQLAPQGNGGQSTDPQNGGLNCNGFTERTSANIILPIEEHVERVPTITYCYMFDLASMDANGYFTDLDMHPLPVYFAGANYATAQARGPLSFIFGLSQNESFSFNGMNFTVSAVYENTGIGFYSIANEGATHNSVLHRNGGTNNMAVFSSSENVVDANGNYPLKRVVVGIRNN